VMVTSAGGTNSTSTQKFIITPAPTVVNITPSSGSNLGLTTLSIFGSGFWGGIGSNTVSAVKLDNGATFRLIQLLVIVL